MENTITTPQQAQSDNNSALSNMGKTGSFIEANTIAASFLEIKENHLIPVFIKDNEPTISHCDFIEIANEAAVQVFPNQIFTSPNIRLSHPIKGRIPEAKFKSANELLEHEKTLYYERMAFYIEIPAFKDAVDGSELTLSFGGVKAYNQDNLYNKKGVEERFKIFVGFKNSICTNLCIWSDGFVSDLKVRNSNQLKTAFVELLERYNFSFHLFCMKKLLEHSLTEHQFAVLVGKCRMYQHLPQRKQLDILPLHLGDNQITQIIRDFYYDNSFSRDESGNINLWRLYNLLTGSNKSSYIDSFLDRSANAFHFTDQLRLSLESKQDCWYLQ